MINVYSTYLAQVKSVMCETERPQMCLRTAPSKYISNAEAYLTTASNFLGYRPDSGPGMPFARTLAPAHASCLPASPAVPPLPAWRWPLQCGLPLPKRKRAAAQSPRARLHPRPTRSHVPHHRLMSSRRSQRSQLTRRVVVDPQLMRRPHSSCDGLRPRHSCQ